MDDKVFSNECMNACNAHKRTKPMWTLIVLVLCRGMTDLQTPLYLTFGSVDLEFKTISLIVETFNASESKLVNLGGGTVGMSAPTQNVRTKFICRILSTK